jgi:alcohol dehydrogenase (NADP+)
MISVAALLSLASVVFAQKTSLPTPPKGVQVSEIPQIGLGTARISGNTSEVIASAIQNGFRHIDCAFMYGNQKDIGVGIKEGLKRTGLARSDLWITSKLGNDRWVDTASYRTKDQSNCTMNLFGRARLILSIDRHGREDFAIRETLDQLGLDYLDLFLVHWPQRKADGKFDHVEVRYFQSHILSTAKLTP